MQVCVAGEGSPREWWCDSSVQSLSCVQFCASPWKQHARLPCSSLIPTAAAAAKSLQSCPTLCDPIDGSPPGSSVHGIFQARVLEWVAIAFSDQLLELAQNHVHQVSDTIQPSHPLLFPSAFNLAQPQGFFPMSQFFTSGGQSIGASASTSVLLMNI